ncbi:MAG: pitrilysin family protein [Ignavibacteriae bacterium]|nr:pitrilysin family protein [Ignavibacteriota bacterium]
MIDRKIMPVGKAPRDIKFPEFHKHTLSNGIKVFFVNDKSYPVTTIRYLFKAGSYNDFFSGKEKFGVATLTAEMINKGTKNKKALNIAEQIDYTGAMLSSGAGYDASYLMMTCLNYNFDAMLDLTTEMIFEHTFPEDELESKKEQLINLLISLQDDGSFLAERVFKTEMYRNTPYQYDPDGYIESIKNINTGDLFDFVRNYYTSKNLIMAVVGDFEEDKILKKIEEKYSVLKSETKSDDYEFINEDKEEVKVYLIEKDDASQTSLHVGHKGIKRNNKDFINVSFLNNLLGGSFTSRINKNLREKNGLTYGARTSFNCKMYSGDFSIETELNADKTMFAVEEIIKELNDIKDNFVSDIELEETKNYITGNYPLQLETSNGVSGKLLNMELYGLNEEYYNTFLRNINSISKEDVSAAAKKYLLPDGLKIVAAGDVSKLKEQLSKFGKIEIIEKVK